MTDAPSKRADVAEGSTPDLVVAKAKDAAQNQGVQAQIYKAISVQRPVVIEYLRSLRRDKPEASAADLLKELDRRYVATVTTTSTGVGASAAIPGVGTGIALSLGVADLLFFYETSALYVLAVAELHGIEVSDAARAQPLVFGMLLGEKSQSAVTQIVLGAIPGAAGADQARKMAAGALGNSGWGEVLTQQLPDSALAPVLTVLARQALKESAKLGAGTLGKALPFGIGAVIGGVGSFTFGRDVVKAAHLAFPEPPAEFPVALLEFEKPAREPAEPSKALIAMQAAAGNVADFGVEVRDTAARATSIFRSVDLDGDGVPDEARALTAVKGAGSTIKGATTGAVGAVGGVFRRRRNAGESADAAPETSDATTED